MNQAVTTVEQWNALNSRNFVECRWGCKLTEQACRTYQSRSPRYVIHFNGSLDACSRVNADFVKCLLPDQCPHFVTDIEIDKTLSGSSSHSDALSLQRKAASRRGRAMERLASPDSMLHEAQWHRSLVKR
jgi:hypothetical protein